MKDKKGVWILGPEVLKLIMAALVILVLASLLFSLTGIFRGKTDIEQARASVKELASVVENLEDGESREFTLISPQDWHLVGWNSEVEIKPEDCAGENCICICEKGNFEFCDKAGLCEILEIEPEVFSFVLSVAPPPNTNQGFCNLHESSCIYITQTLPLILSRQGSEVSIIPREGVGIRENGERFATLEVKTKDDFSCYDSRRVDSETYGCAR